MISHYRHFTHKRALCDLEQEVKVKFDNAIAFFTYGFLLVFIVQYISNVDLTCKRMCFLMGEILTAGDLPEGHSHLSVGNVIYLRLTTKNIPQMIGAYHTGQSMPYLKFVKVRFQTVALSKVIS